MKGIEIVYLPIDKITPYERNARKHGEKDIDAIRASIRRFGFNDPLGIWSDKNIVVEGHGRLLAAKAEGMTELPCIRLDHLTDEQRRAYAAAHNRTAELSEWDDDTLKAELGDIFNIDMSEFGFEVLQDITGSEYNLRDQVPVKVDETSDGRECECPECGFRFYV